MSALSIFRKLGRRPSLDWYFSLSCVGIMFIVVIALSASLYYRLILDASAPVAAPNDSTIAFDREAVDKALERMAQADADAKVFPSSVLADPS